MSDFYEQLTPFFHLIYEDWDKMIGRHGEMLDEIIRAEWDAAGGRVLDVSCGIGTQSMALAQLGHQVTASDLSAAAVARAREEAAARGLQIPFSAADMRTAYGEHGGGFDVVLTAGNSLPHLLNDGEIMEALRAFYACLRPGGGCIITMRQYDQEARGRGLFHPMRVHQEGQTRTVIFQVWDFQGDVYDFSMYVVEEDMEAEQATTHVMRSSYYAISPNRVAELMQEAGFRDVKRLDDGVNHPAIVVGTKDMR